MSELARHEEKEQWKYYSARVRATAIAAYSNTEHHPHEEGHDVPSTPEEAPTTATTTQHFTHYTLMLKPGDRMLVYGESTSVEGWLVGAHEASPDFHGIFPKSFVDRCEVSGAPMSPAGLMGEGGLRLSGSVGDDDEDEEEDDDGSEYDTYGFRKDGEHAAEVGMAERLDEQLKVWRKLEQAYPRMLEDPAYDVCWQQWKYKSAGGGAMKTAQKAIKKAVQGGVHPDYRARVWYLCSGARDLEGKAQPHETYENILQEMAEDPVPDDDQAKIDIEKDLHRTFPTNTNFQKEEGIQALRRVLMAYSRR